MKKRSHFYPIILAKIETINLKAGISTVKKVRSYNANGSINNDKLSGNQLRKMHQKFSQCSSPGNSILRICRIEIIQMPTHIYAQIYFNIRRIIRQVVVYVACKELLMTYKKEFMT